jgi:hypothetical protein
MGDMITTRLHHIWVLIYMSIQTDIQGLQHARVLFPYFPVSTRRLPKRRLFLTARAEKERADPNSATNILCHPGLLHAALDRWVLGDRIYGDRSIRYLSDLCPPPPEVWEIRVVEPKRQQARLFGRFVEPDTLILTAFHTRNLLGDKGSQTWTDAMADCVSQWNSFSSSLPVFSAASIREYVTENCDDFPIKLCAASPQRPRRVRRR